MLMIQSRNRCLYDGTAEAVLHDIFAVMERKVFGKREAADIVGGTVKLNHLINSGKIRLDIKENGKKWRCNAADVLRFANIKFRRKRRNIA